MECLLNLVNNRNDSHNSTWLGTSSAAPCKTRNTSATALRLDGEVRQGVCIRKR